MSRIEELPPKLRKALAEPAAGREAWSARLAGVLISGYLWVAYYDTLPPATLSRGGLPAAVGGGAVGGLLACVLLFLPAAMQGLRTRYPLMVVATSAFGVRGAALVPGLLLGLVQILWFAVAVHYAVEFNLRGLRSLGLIEPEDIRSARGAWQVHRSTVYAASALLWGIASALVATRFIRWIAALMIVYPVFIALALGGAMLWAVPGLPVFGRAAVDPAIARPRGEWPAFWAMAQLVSGFGATVAAQAVNWGATLRDRRDVLLAGVVGVWLASAIVATLAVLTVAGAMGRDLPVEPEPFGPGITLIDPGAPGSIAGGETIGGPSQAMPEPMTIGTVFEDRIGGIAGGIGLIVLGLGSLASAVYSAYAFSNRLEAIRSRPRRWAWGAVGAVVAFPLMITGLAANVPLVIDLTAGVLAPMLGVLAADLVLNRVAWPGPRPGFRRPGMLGWGIGSAVGLLPVASRVALAPSACRWLPLAMIAFAVAFAVAASAEAADRFRGRGSRPDSPGRQEGVG